eukprot:gene5355-9163_t
MKKTLQRYSQSTFNGKLPLISVKSKNSPHKSTVIFLHGLGDTGDGWSQEFSFAFKEKFQETKFLFPTADNRSISINMGHKMPGWYDIYSLEDRTSKEDKKGILESKESIEEILEWQINEEKIPSEKIILGGFSQGGAMSLYTGLTLSKTIGGILCMSGYVPIQVEVEKNLNKKNISTPILMCHGTGDNVVPIEFAQHSHEFLKMKREKNLNFLTYAGMDHTACQKEFEDVTKWLEKIL